MEARLLSEAMVILQRNADSWKNNKQCPERPLSPKILLMTGFGYTRRSVKHSLGPGKTIKDGGYTQQPEDPPGTGERP